MISLQAGNFSTIHFDLLAKMKDAPVVEVGEWQSRQGGGESSTIELQDVVFSFPIADTIVGLVDDVVPNLTWAEDHFKERISGKPLNPPPSSDWWPHNVAGNASSKAQGKFSHTYPERLWPKSLVGKGIRYAYGDLSDTLELLRTRPDTRQAYVPIWFPEDVTASLAGERVPCTLGYHLMQRNGRLNIHYYMRSCDFVRHFADDVYMAARLCQWFCDELDLEPGDLIMTISSLHAFSTERDMLRAWHETELGLRLRKAF